MLIERHVSRVTRAAKRGRVTLLHLALVMSRLAPGSPQYFPFIGSWVSKLGFHSLSSLLYCIILLTERLRVLNDELQQVRCGVWWEGVGGHWPMYGYDSYLAPESLPPQLAKISAVYHRRLIEILNIVPLATPT